jgi:hypothetical protein
MSDFKPGQSIRCTVKSIPGSASGKSTILRLMRQDSDIRKALRRGQKERFRKTRVYIRGGRDFYIRPRAGKIAHVATGESWTMDYIPHLAGDLRSVEKFVTTEVV